VKDDSNRLTTIHEENNVKFCMKKCAGKAKYQVKVGREIYYSHWDFDTAVREYWIVRKEQANKSILENKE